METQTQGRQRIEAAQLQSLLPFQVKSRIRRGFEWGAEIRSGTEETSGQREIQSGCQRNRELGAKKLKPQPRWPSKPDCVPPPGSPPAASQRSLCSFARLPEQLKAKLFITISALARKKRTVAHTLGGRWAGGKSFPWKCLQMLI